VEWKCIRGGLAVETVLGRTGGSVKVSVLADVFGLFRALRSWKEGCLTAINLSLGRGEHTISPEAGLNFSADKSIRVLQKLG